MRPESVPILRQKSHLEAAAQMRARGQPGHFSTVGTMLQRDDGRERHLSASQIRAQSSDYKILQNTDTVNAQHLAGAMTFQTAERHENVTT